MPVLLDSFTNRTFGTFGAFEWQDEKRQDMRSRREFPQLKSTLGRGSDVSHFGRAVKLNNYLEHFVTALLSWGTQGWWVEQAISTQSELQAVP